MKQLKQTHNTESAPFYAFCKKLKLEHSKTKRTRLFEKDRRLTRVQGTLARELERNHNAMIYFHGNNK